MHFGQLYITTEQLRYFVQIFDIKNIPLINTDVVTLLASQTLLNVLIITSLYVEEVWFVYM